MILLRSEAYRFDLVEGVESVRHHFREKGQQAERFRQLGKSEKSNRICINSMRV